MKEIPLTQGKVALVDDEDYDALAQHKWCAVKIGKWWYAARGANGKQELMHRAILQSQPGSVTDHINGNGLDNRRDNLRQCSTSENLRNRRIIAANNTSGYKGVTWHKAGHKWQAAIGGQHRRYLGLFDTPEEAARAYDHAARAAFGEFARLNFQ